MTLSRSLYLLVLFLLFAGTMLAQKNYVRGTVLDTAENRRLRHAIVALIDLSDTTLYRSVRTDALGKFSLDGIPAGRYTLLISYPRLADFLQALSISDTTRRELGEVAMVSKATLLQEVIVTAGLPIRMRGDTLEYTADSFAVRPGANVLEMLKRLPGIWVDKNGRIEAQGETVRKILVDGDEFFSDDPGLAARYLRADAIDKVQVFDQKSDKTLFTGIDDGLRTKTINLKLKSDKKNGYFGKLAAGSSGQGHYQHEAMGAFFNGTRKAAVFGMTAKTGRQGLSYYDIGRFAGGDQAGGGADAAVFGDALSFGNSGLPAVINAGAHYSDKWNDKKQEFMGNYRIKQNETTDWNKATSTIVLPDGTGFFNKKASSGNSSSLSHRANGALYMVLDSFSTLRVSAGGSTANSKGYNNNGSGSKNEKGFMVNSSRQTNSAERSSEAFSSSVNYNRRFRKEGRTFSAQFRQDYSKGVADNYLFSAANYYDPATGNYVDADTLNQLQQSMTPLHSYDLDATFTEAIAKNIRVAVNYYWSNDHSANVFKTYNRGLGKYEEKVDSLSNDYDFTNNRHAVGFSLSWSLKKLGFTLSNSMGFFHLSQLNRDLDRVVHRRYTNLQPSLRSNLRLSNKENLTFEYKGYTEQPSLEQLQPLRRTSSQLYVQLGNPALRPGFRHNVSISYSNLNAMRMQNFRASVSAGYASNSIINRTTIDAQNRTVSQYINMNTIPNLQAVVFYNFQVPKWKLRNTVNFTTSRSGSYLFQNGKRVRNDRWGAILNAMLSHQLGQSVITGYVGNVSYSTGWSDIPGTKTTRNLTHSHSVSTTITLPGKIDLNTDCSVNFQPRNSAFNNSLTFVRWNASVEKRFLPNQQLAVRASINDILNNNTGYTRSVSGNNIYESDHFVLKRYWLFTAEWNFNGNFK